MKAIGIVRQIDKLGRIVIPIETRRKMDINERDSVEMFVEEDRLILKKYQPSCIFCGDADDVLVFREKRVCRRCMNEIKGQAESEK